MAMGRGGGRGVDLAPVGVGDDSGRLAQRLAGRQRLFARFEPVGGEGRGLRGAGAVKEAMPLLTTYHCA